MSIVKASSILASSAAALKLKPAAPDAPDKKDDLQYVRAQPGRARARTLPLPSADLLAVGMV